MVAAFSQDISASLSLSCTFVIYLHLWNFLEGGLGGRRGPPHRHMLDSRRVFLSDQYPWTLTCSTVSYEVFLWFPLLGRIIDKMWYLSPPQGPKFLLHHNVCVCVCKTKVFDFWLTSPHQLFLFILFNLI